MKHKDAIIKAKPDYHLFGVVVDGETEVVTIPKSDFLDLLLNLGDARFIAYHLFKNDGEVTIAKIVYEELLKKMKDDLTEIFVSELNKELEFEKSKLTRD